MQGLDGNLDPRGVETGRNPAGVPKACSRADQLIVRSLDEDSYFYGPVVLRERIAHDLTHGDPAVENGTAGPDRSQGIGVQNVLGALVFGGDQGRVLQAHEVALGPIRCRFCRIDLDIGTRDQGAETADAAGGEPRPDHPEASLIAQVILHLLIQFRV